MNQNRNQNRRRGRGNNRGGQGGGNQGNRIDSRARGNAPQMLEKYRKLAHDASLNGDRVQTEYYLQFADHYFRVIADMRSQKDEQRPPRREYDRDQPFDDYDGDEREEAAREEPRGGRRDRYEDDRAESERDGAEEGRRGAEGDQGEEAAAEDNPFLRETRAPRERQAERGERSGQRGRGRNRPANDASEEAAGEATFDAAVLPPSIAREPGDDEAKPAPRPARTRTRRARPADDDGDEALEAVS